MDDDVPTPEEAAEIQREAEEALRAQHGKPPAGIPEAVGRWLAMRSAAISRAVHGRDAPGKPVGNKGNTYGVGKPPPDAERKS